MTKKEGDQITVMENLNVMVKSVSSDSNVLHRPIKDYVMEKPEPSTPEDSSTSKEVMMKKEGDQTTIMENQKVMEKSVSSDSNDSNVLHRPIKDYVMEKPEPSTPEASTCKEVKKESRKTNCNKKGSSLQINLKNFYQVDGILLENECGENYPRILNKKERDKKSLEDFKKEPQTKTKGSMLSSRQICENIHYFYYDLKGSFINQFCLEIVDNVRNEEELKKLGEGKQTDKGQKIYSDSETDKDDDELEKKESKESEVVCESKSNNKEEKDLVETASPDNCLNELNKSDVIHDTDTDKYDDELENKESKESEAVPKNKSNDKDDLDLKKEGDQTSIMENQKVMEKSVSSDSNASGTALDTPIKDYVMEKPEPSTPEDLDLIEQESPEKCLDESNKSDVIHEVDVGEGIHLEIFKDKEELVNDMTEQEVSRSIVEECRLREELGEKNEISKRQVFVCMGPIYNELLDDAVSEELEATFQEDETLKQIKRSDRIKEKAEKDMVFDILHKE